MPRFFDYQRAKKTVQQMGVQSKREYLVRYQEYDGLPKNPNIFYKDEWASWLDFFGVKNKYYSFEEFLGVIKEKKISNSKSYQKAFLEDDKLPEDISEAYGEDPNWKGLKSVWEINAQKGPKKNWYTLAEFVEIVQSFGIKSENEYRVSKLHKKDPRLPSHPWILYKKDPNFAAVLTLFGKKTPEDRRRLIESGERYSYEEASALVREKEIISMAEYKKACEEDPKLPADPKNFYSELGWVNKSVFFGNGDGARLPKRSKIPYPYEIAVQVVQAVNLKSREEYENFLKKDTKLPLKPAKFYFETGWCSWSKFLGKSLTRSGDPKEIDSYFRAKAKVIQNEVFSIKDYRSLCKRDPKLSPNPDIEYFAEWRSWEDFFDPANFFYPYEEVFQQILTLGIKNFEDYTKRAEVDLRFPKDPEKFYLGSGWISWAKFFPQERSLSPKTTKRETTDGVGARMGRKPIYYQAIMDASLACKALEINSQFEYADKRTQDPRLHPKPDKYYKLTGWPGWKIFLNPIKVEKSLSPIKPPQGPVIPVKNFYPTWRDASSACRRLGIGSMTDYKVLCHQDPRLHNSPSAYYQDWPGWVKFFDHAS